MNAHAEIITADEQARRRRVVSSADWSCRMEGLGKPTESERQLDEMWITGKISRSDYEAQAAQQLKAWIAKLGA